MKKKIIQLTIVNLLIIIVFIAVTVISTTLQENMYINVCLGESHEGKTNIAQLYYAPEEKKLRKKVNENPSVTITFPDDTIACYVGDIDFDTNYVRIDPFNQMEEFSVEKVTLSYDKYTVFTLTGTEFMEYVSQVRNIKITEQDSVILCKSKNTNPAFIMNASFSALVQRYYNLINVLPYVILIILMVVWNGAQWHKTSEQMNINRWLRYGGVLLTTILIGSGVALVYTFSYFKKHFGEVALGQLLYHLCTPLDGTDVSSYGDVIVRGIVLTVGVMVLYLLCRWFVIQKGRRCPISLWIAMAGLFLVCYGGIKACYHFDIPQYYAYTHSGTTLYDEYYVDGREVNITFPEKKRNLIYIFLESMEITYADKESGGAMTDNYIPELTALGLENETFSDGTGLNGAYAVLGATFTMGALAAQTSGVPINENLVSNETLNGTWESENNYLPGVWNIGDILQEQGYNQEFLIGSNGKFAGRSSYFKGHGGYRVEDYCSAIGSGRIASDYKVWWGYEDEKLFDFAREDIVKLAQEEEPFNMTLLTVDTHFTDGYVCELCKEEHDSQYSNVMACSSRQVAEFIDWAKQQDFYENTTIVIAGDHLTPDSYYIAKEGATGFNRKTFFTIVNPAEGKQTDGRMREYTTMDLFPTTLSGLGVTIEGSRLGLGVDLYSGEPTLVEKLGLETLNGELLKNSDYYTKKLLYKNQN